MINFENVKAMWLSQFDMCSIYCKDGKQREIGEFIPLVDKVFDRLTEIGINTAIIQTRPNADSMYPSKYYTMSKYVVGKYGKNASYDPLRIIIDSAHAHGISIHAWINPLRCMTEDEIKSVSEDFAIGKWYNDKEINGKMIVQVGKNFYLDPAYEEVRNLIVDGASELLDLYDVDGLHMDDYFYPTTDESFDSFSYSEYLKNGGKLELADFRRDSLDKLVSSLYSMTKAKNERLWFGISPAGVISQVLDKHYANVVRWCSEDGFIDYICPQIYFGIEHPTCPFMKLCDDWQAMVTNKNVRLIIGMTLGKAYAEKDEYAKDASDEWKNNKDVMYRCLDYARNLKLYSGVAYFCYQYFYDSVTGEERPNTQKERDNLIPLLKSI